MENISNIESLDTNTLKLILRKALVERQEDTQADFLKFVKSVWPDFIEGYHHKIYAEKLNRVANGELKRLIVNMPPRHTKSEFASHLFPAFFMGRNPKSKLIQTTHTGELSIRLGERQRTYWSPKNMLKSFLVFIWRLILKLLDVGSQIMAVSILLLVSVVQLPVVVLIFLSLMILTRSRMR